jgi:2,3-bisphosphoglycerate-independent phosphoglycerate mutase
LPTFKERYGLSGSVISAVDLLKGIGIYAGLDSINVPGATGYLDTDYKGKVRYALSELRKKDFVYLHVEAPDEASHNGDIYNKIKAIEDFDSLIVGGIIRGIQGIGDIRDIRILLMTDHFTPLSTRTHSADPVPFAIYPCKGEPDGVQRFDESILRDGSIHLEKGYELMDYFIQGGRS